MKVANSMVQYKEEHSDCLTRKLFPVNIRLLKENTEYKEMIKDIVKNMLKLINTEFEDYGKLRGISGANLGIPFNIIVVKGSWKDSVPVVMINPEITWRSISDTTTVKSNCGSLCLSEPVEVSRYKRIKVKYYMLDGEDKEELFSMDKRHKAYHESTPTIQHEIDHNNGVLITGGN